VTFRDPELLKLALTHRSYLSVTGMGPQESNERLEFLGDSVLGLVTSEFLYRQNPDEHEGQLTKTKSLLVSKAILSRRALAMGLGRFVLMSHSEVESGGRQRLSIIADAFEAVLGAIYLDQGFEAARQFVEQWLLREAREIAADKRHTNYKSHLQEYVQSTFHTHPVYRIRSEMGPDHSKQFMVEVMVGKRSLGQGRGRNKKEAEQAAARDALEKVEPGRNRGATDHADERRPARTEPEAAAVDAMPDPDAEGFHEGPGAPRRRGRRGGRGRRLREEGGAESRQESSFQRETEPRREPAPAPAVPPPVASPVVARPPLAAPLARTPVAPPVARAPVAPPAMTPRERMARPPVEETIPLPEVEPEPPAHEEDFDEEVGRPEGPLEERHIDPYAFEELAPARAEAEEFEVQAPEVEIAPEETDIDTTVMETEENPSDGDDDFQPAPGSLFSHEREPQEERPAGREERAPQFGRRGRRRGR